MRHQIGESGVLTKPLPTLCCGYPILEGSVIKILRRTSDQPGNPRVVEVHVLTGGMDNTLHKVKLSKIWMENIVVQEVT